MLVREAYDLISRAVDAGRANRGFLVVGDVPGDCSELVELVQQKLFGTAKLHPDVVFLEPEGKSRTIKVDSMREKIVLPMAQTSYAGGWKLGVVRCADRMNLESANAFLKSLEEPTPKTMYLLLTDNPQSCLPTIISRCQRIDLPPVSDLLKGEYYEEVKALFESSLPATLSERDRFASKLAGILSSVKEESQDEDVQLVRKAFFCTIMSFARKWMVEGRLEGFRAYRNIEAIEEAYRRTEKSLSDDMVISALADKLSFPV